jgi:hypothetical protein
MLNSNQFQTPTTPTATSPVVPANDQNSSASGVENTIPFPPYQPPLQPTKGQSPVHPKEPSWTSTNKVLDQPVQKPRESTTSGDAKKAVITGSLIGGAIIIGFLLTRSPQSGETVSRNTQTPSSTPIPSLTPSSIPSSTPTKLAQLPSAIELPPLYNQLNYYLERGQWQQADTETFNIMIQLVGRKTLDSQSIYNFPCNHLKIIDRLWSEYSKRKFGFSKQQQIWKEIGGNLNASEETWKSFAVAVGWKSSSSDNNRYLEESQYVYNLNAPDGHLPATFCCYPKNRQWWYSIFAEKVKQCNL